MKNRKPWLQRVVEGRRLKKEQKVWGEITQKYFREINIVCLRFRSM